MTKKNRKTNKNDRQHQIGKIYRNMRKQGFDAKTAIWVALQETQDFSK